MNFRANKYIAKMLGDEVSLTLANGVEVGSDASVFWAHAWRMLHANVSYSETSKMWNDRMCEIDPAKTQQLDALSIEELDALVRVGICTEPSLEMLHIIAVRMSKPDLVETL